MIWLSWVTVVLCGPFVLWQLVLVTTVTFLTVWALVVEAISTSMSCQNIGFGTGYVAMKTAMEIYLLTILKQFACVRILVIRKVLKPKHFFCTYHCHRYRNILSPILLTFSNSTYSVWWHKPMLNLTDCPINWFSLLALILEYSLPQSWMEWNWRFWSRCTG